jgi:putative tryptophan/tyrosine transport system substrate-binding protein
MGSYIERREFLATLLGGAAAAWPLAARAQQSGQLPTIGFLGAGTLSTYGPWATAFMQRLRELGWIEGRNIAIEYRWAEGRNERYSEIATEFTRLKVDAIVTTGTGAVVAAKQATAAIPIVFTSAGDPVATGLVASLARPGGNVTGLSNQLPDAAGKRLDLLREIVPNLRRLAILTNIASPIGAVETAQLQAAARPVGIEILALEIRRAEDIAPRLEELKGRAGALYVVSEPLMSVSRVRINTLALGMRVPTLHGFREYVEAGGLMSYGPNLLNQFRRAADIVDKILRGAKPGDIPVEQPTKFDLVVNLTTAKMLGLTIPESFLLRADEVIE